MLHSYVALKTKVVERLSAEGVGPLVFRQSCSILWDTLCYRGSHPLIVGREVGSHRPVVSGLQGHVSVKTPGRHLAVSTVASGTQHQRYSVNSPKDFCELLCWIAKSLETIPWLLHLEEASLHRADR